MWNLSDGGARTLASPVFGPITENGLSWSAVKLGLHGDGTTRLLLRRSDGAAAVWLLDGNLNFVSSSPAYGPYSGWTPVDMAVARDGSLRLLWTNTGRASVWNITLAGQVSLSPTFGPYSESSGSWEARKVAVGGDGLARLLWNRSDGQGAVWTLDSGLNYASSSPGYGPYSGWNSKALALDTSDSSDNKRRLLWTNSDGRAAFWKVAPDSFNLEVNALYGPYSGWTAQTISVGGDGQTRALWTNTDGRAAFWKLSPDGGALQVNATFGPLPEPAPTPLPSGVGKIVFESRLSTDPNSRLYVMNGDGSDRTRLTDAYFYDDTNPSFSPDGNRVVFVSTQGSGNKEIYLIGADGSGRTRLTTSSAVEDSPKFSPDGKRIVFVSNRSGNFEITLMNADGTGQTQLTNTPANEVNPSFSPDGTKIVFENGDGIIFRMNADGTGMVQLTSANTGNPSFSPDGTKIVYAFNGGTGAPQITLMNLDGSGQTPVTNIDGQKFNPHFSPDGKRIGFSTYTTNGFNTPEIRVVNADGTGVARLASGGLGYGWAPGKVAPRPTTGPSGGRIAFDSGVYSNSSSYGSQNSQIFVVDADGTNQEQLTFDQGYSNDNSQPSFSRDGRQIAFVQLAYVGRSFTPAYSSNINVMNADGTNRRQITSYVHASYPSFSPDGTKIVFSAYPSEIYLINVDGSGMTRLTNTPESETHPVFSADGSKILFASKAYNADYNAAADLYQMNLDGSGRTLLTNTANNPAAALNGSKIAFDATGQIFTANPDGSGRTALSSGPNDTNPTFSPDSTFLAFGHRDANSNTPSIDTIPVNGSGGGISIFGANPSWGPRYVPAPVATSSAERSISSVKKPSAPSS